MQIAARVGVSLRCPNFAFAEVEGCAALGVEQSDVDAEPDAGKHHLALHAGLKSGGGVDCHQILFEFECREVDTCRGSVTELRRAFERE